MTHGVQSSTTLGNHCSTFFMPLCIALLLSFRFPFGTECLSSDLWCLYFRKKLGGKEDGSPLPQILLIAQGSICGSVWQPSFLCMSWLRKIRAMFWSSPFLYRNPFFSSKMLLNLSLMLFCLHTVILFFLGFGIKLNWVEIWMYGFHQKKQPIHNIVWDKTIPTPIIFTTLRGREVAFILQRVNFILVFILYWSIVD